MICFHGLPMSGPEELAAKVLPRRDAMVSFAHPGQVGIAMEVCRSVAFDNGAFSAWKAGNPITDWTDYQKWILEWNRHPAFAWHCIPDVIDGSEAENNDLIFCWPFKDGVPIWHLHESIAKLKWLVRDFRLVALGSSGKFAVVGSRPWWDRMAQAMSVACDEQGRPMTKLHGLRMLDPTVLAHLPLASADSTNAARNMGIDSAWRGTYQPASRAARAVVIMDRIEHHATAVRWSGTSGEQRAFELLDYGLTA